MLDPFEKFLSSKGLRLTKQRRKIVQAFLDHKEHVSAEELYLKVKEGSPEIGYTTVYRTLKLLFEADLAHASNFGDGFARFEPAHLGEHHDHLICRKCGGITEFVSEHIEKMQKNVARDHGFKITDHTLDIYGVCRDCQ